MLIGKCNNVYCMLEWLELLTESSFMLLNGVICFGIRELLSEIRMTPNAAMEERMVDIF